MTNPWAEWCAIARLLQAITSPAHALSAIVVEAYKKYALVSIMENGKVRVASLARRQTSMCSCD